MSEFPNAQPNVIDHKGRRISYQYGAPVDGSALESVVVSVSPGVTGALDVVVGIGPNHYAAKADAFTRARQLIDRGASE